MTNSPDAFEHARPFGTSVLERPRRPINLVAGTIGHFVEWYDWYIYGLLAAIFASQIFPSDSPFASLIAALLTYAIGFVIRPSAESSSPRWPTATAADSSSPCRSPGWRSAP